MSKKHSIEEAKQKFLEKGLYLLEEVYINNKTLMKAYCPLHPNKEIFLRMNDVISGQGCKYCGIERRVKNRRNDFKEVQKSFEEKGYELLSSQEDYINSNTKLAYICPNHNEKIQYITYVSIKNGHECNLCATKKNAENKKKDFTEIQNYFKEVGYTLLSKSNEYQNSSSKLRYICPKHENIVQEVSWSNFYGKQSRCRYCAPQMSKGELKIEEYFRQNHIDFITQKKFDDLRNPTTNYLLSYDFYLPKYNILIEYQGGYHDGKVHERNEKRQSITQLKRQKIRDELKKNYAKKNGYNFIEIWYWDYKNIESLLEKELKKYEYTIS